MENLRYVARQDCSVLDTETGGTKWFDTYTLAVLHANIMNGRGIIAPNDPVVMTEEVDD